MKTKTTTTLQVTAGIIHNELFKRAIKFRSYKVQIDTFSGD